MAQELPTFYKTEILGLNTDYKIQGHTKVWNFGAACCGGKQIANGKGMTKSVAHKKNFKDCVEQVWCFFDETKEGGEAFFHLLNLCNIRCIGQE